MELGGPDGGLWGGLGGGGCNGQGMDRAMGKAMDKAMTPCAVRAGHAPSLQMRLITAKMREAKLGSEKPRSM